MKFFGNLGEQEIMDMPTKPEMIYFGLLPHKRDPEVDMVHTGFQGCMSHLQVAIYVVFYSKSYFQRFF